MRARRIVLVAFALLCFACNKWALVSAIPADAPSEAPPSSYVADGGGDDDDGDDAPLVYPEGEPRAGEFIQPVIEARVDDPAIVEAATWAVAHLANLSDSGVYTSIRLRRIVDAATQEGVYHNNTMITVELESPYLLDAEPMSVHKIIVMADLEDGVRSFAIDEFPIVEPDAIEKFWVEKVERQRAARVVELAALEREFDEHYAAICGEDATRAALMGASDALPRCRRHCASCAAGSASVAADGPIVEVECNARASGDGAQQAVSPAAEHSHITEPIRISDLRGAKSASAK